MWTGNHDYPPTRIVCDMDRRWRRPNRQYLRLFFLDEATAFAAGFRPCNQCRRDAKNAFFTAWATAVGEAPDRVRVVDERLGRERGSRPSTAPGDLPAGTMIDIDGTPLLVAGDGIRRWSLDGYGPLRAHPPRAALITPRSTVAVLAAGYPIGIHPSGSS